MLSRSFKRFSRSRNRRDAGAAGGPFAEALEVRRHYTVTAVLDTSTHILTVTGDGTNTEITIYQLHYQTGDTLGVHTNNGAANMGPFLVSAVNLIKVNGGGASETIQVESSWRGNISHGDTAVSKPVDFYGSYGNDTLWGSDQADLLDGGPDNDSVTGGAASDTMYGGTGNDVLDGINPSGDTTADYMYGGAGSDTFWAQDNGAFDYIDGGADSDTLASSDNGVDTILNVP
jgi:Ca2+-binding RTX toxin-like protein